MLLPSGSWVRVRAGRTVAYGLWDDESAVALRIWSLKACPTEATFEKRLALAHDLREPLRATGTDSYRLINGEGDGFPGVVLDRYGPFGAMRLYAPGLRELARTWAKAIAEIAQLRGVVLRSQAGTEKLCGRLPPKELIVSEHGCRFFVDLFAGQKTGLFLDHRENRRFIAEQCSGKDVLNLYAYTGGFSVHAAMAGARSVTSVDIASAAMARARDNFALNGLSPDQHEFVVADVPAFIEGQRQGERRWDVIIADPPSFAKNRGQRRTAFAAYRRLHQRAVRLLSPGGLYAAASCTAQISWQDFHQTLREAQGRTKRVFQVIHDAGHALDHPVCHAEGRYLKFVVQRVLPRD